MEWASACLRGSHLQAAQGKLGQAFESRGLDVAQRSVIGTALGQAALSPTLARKPQAQNVEAAERYLDTSGQATATAACAL